VIRQNGSIRRSHSRRAGPPFLFYNKPADPVPLTTTRRRVLGEAAKHLYEHEPQVLATLAR
jgi:hypothetical protein